MKDLFAMFLWELMKLQTRSLVRKNEKAKRKFEENNKEN